jgi:hypothetical protein
MIRHPYQNNDCKKIVIFLVYIKGVVIHENSNKLLTIVFI